MKKLLSLLLAISMILSMMSITVFATETEDTTPVPVAQVGDTTYETLAAAVEAAEAGATVTLLADVTLDQQLVIDKDITITGDHTINTSVADAFWVTGGNLYLHSVNVCGTEAILWCNGGNIVVGDYSVVELDNADCGNCAVYVDRGSLYIEEDCVITANNACTTVSVSGDEAGCFVHGGAILSESCTAVVAKDGAYVYVLGGEIGTAAEDTYVSMYSISGGTINISGGTVEGYAEADSNGILNISGGYVENVEGTDGTVTITGGTFGTDVTAYCADGLVCEVDENGKFVIQDAPAATSGVAKIGETTYETLAEAVYEANGNGGEIVLLADTTLSEKLDINGTVILNLDGHTVTTAAVDDNYSIVVNHSLTITGDGTMNVEGVYGIGVKATGTLTVNGGTFNAAENSDYLIGNWGTTTINGGTFNGVYCCVNNFGGTTTINGGSYTTEATDASGAYESCDLFADAGMTVYGGSFSKEGVKDYVAEGATVTINGEEYTAGSTEEVPENSEQNPTYVTFTMNEDYTEGTATVTVPAGATYYFATTNNIGGMTMTANWYEVEVTYGNMWMGTDSTWSITNDTDADIEYLITISYPVGSQMNPAELSTEWANYSYHEAGSQGWFYTWTAPVDGILTLSFRAEDANWNELGWFYVVNNMTTYIYGENQNSSSEPVVNPAIVTVAEGDEIQIIVNTYDPANEYNAPAGDMYVTASFVCAEHGETEAVYDWDDAVHNLVCVNCGTVIDTEAHEYVEGFCACGLEKAGSENNPVMLWEQENTVENAGTVWYQGYFNGMTMTVEGDGEFSIIYNGVTTAYTSNAELAVASANPRMPVIFAIVGDGIYQVNFTYPVGAFDNPEVIENIIAFADTNELAENGSYYYIWTAEEDATVVLDITDGANLTVDKLTYTEDSEWPITEQFALAEAEYDENWNYTGWIVEENLVIDVKAGQQLKIQVTGLTDWSTWMTPAVTYTVSGAAMVTAEGECDTNAETVDVILSLADLELADANAIMVKLPSGDLELKSYEWLLEGDLTTDDTDKTAWAANDAIAVNGADGFLKLTFEAPEAVGEYDFQCEVTVKYEDEVLANVLVDGTVNVTMPAEPTEQIKINSATLTLSEDISVLYKATVPAGYSDPYMVFTFNGKDYKITEYTVEAGTGRLCFVFPGVTPQCMKDNISATLYATYGSKEYTNIVDSYSVLKYCTNQLGRNPNAKLKALLSDLLVYGEKSQLYMNYKTNNLVTAGLSLSPSKFPTLDSSFNQQKLTGNKDANVNWSSAALTLANNVKMRFGIKTTQPEKYTYEVTINGKTTVYTAEDLIPNGEGKWYLDFPGIMANQFNRTVTAVIKYNGVQVGQTLTYSVNTYIWKYQADTTSLGNLLRAIYNYGNSAANY